MSEKQTTPQSAERYNAPEDETELISQDFIDMVNAGAQEPETLDWNTERPVAEDDFSAAAKRMLGESETPPSFAPQSYIADRSSFNIPERSDVAEASERSGADRYSLLEKGTRVAVGAALTGAAVFGTGAALAEMNGGSDNPERGEADPAITSLVIDADSNLRNDPNVDRTTPNKIGSPKDRTEITVTHPVRIFYDSANGIWYGVHEDDLPNGGRGDKDGVIWVNEQGVRGVTRGASDPTNLAPALTAETFDVSELPQAPEILDETSPESTNE